MSFVKQCVRICCFLCRPIWFHVPSMDLIPSITSKLLVQIWRVSAWSSAADDRMQPTSFPEHLSRLFQLITWRQRPTGLCDSSCCSGALAVSATAWWLSLVTGIITQITASRMFKPSGPSSASKITSCFVERGPVLTLHFTSLVCRDHSCSGHHFEQCVSVHLPFWSQWRKRLLLQSPSAAHILQHSPQQTKLTQCPVYFILHRSEDVV